MDELMDHMLRGRFTPASYQRVWAPRVDVYDNGTEFVAIVELAGVSQDAVSIEVEDQEVAIVGERSVPTTGHPECDGANALQLEIAYGPFERRLLLPEIVDAAEATASFDGGLLTIRLPKAGHQPRRVQVPIS
jgi:HSP20 family protein